jgi:hypothetical protein
MKIKGTPIRVDLVTSESRNYLPKRQHYVPQCLLRRFAIQGVSGEPRIHFYDKKLDREGVSTIRGVASENGFYNFKEQGETFTLEFGFNKVEQAADRAVESIVSARSVGRLANDDRAILADYLIKQLIRTRRSREDSKAMLVALEKTLELRGFPLREAFPDYKPITEERVNQLSIDQLRDGSISPELLLDKGWMLLETTAVHPFLTSDNPVGRSNYRADSGKWPRGSRGLRSPYVEIYFPLTPTLCLSLVSKEHMQEIWQGYQRLLAIERMRPERAFELWEAKATCEHMLDDLKSGEAHQVTPDMVVNINSVQCNDCKRQVYSAFPDFSIAKEMKKDGCFDKLIGGTWVAGDE